ncbi:MAG TPA: flagellar export chaperone FliS [Candidatus Ruthenibacterium merdavium]|uniref:Flagellar export chaperone FliS n=1 Tax=Candidatus Ruthenibacterium merdavium TaxID=2838752 RepID=A0A9D2Q5G5_9FIRM|nr:flagellar export chaperone FliS [Candidatus Ruthenibacterium merdavium]
MLQNKYQAYKQQSVMTMTQGEMLNTLYDGLLKALYAAKGGLETRDYTVANRELIRAQKILNYLKTTLNHQYEIANNLEMLYNFFLQQIVQANVRKSSEHMDDVIEMVTQLRDAFVQADKNVRSQG